MVTMCWDMALVANTLMLYYDADLLMKQKHVAPIIRWEGAENMLEQWPILLEVILWLQEKHPVVYKLANLLEDAEEVSSQLRDQAKRSIINDGISHQTCTKRV